MSYQQVVAEVAHALDPAAEISIGVWVEGPDGLRDLDVLIRPKVGVPIVIECKDWNRPIGIGHIDALESKRRDIGAAFAMICSNSGFTADALTKAARVGIPVLAALKHGDDRINVVVNEQIYTRKIRFDQTQTAGQIHHEEIHGGNALLKGVSAEEFSFETKPVLPWLATELLRLMGTATESRSIQAAYTFRQPLHFQARGISISVQGMSFRVAFVVEWWTQIARLDASHGMYDYLKKRLLMGPQSSQFHMTADTASWGTQVSAADVPPMFLVPANRRSETDRGARMELAYFTNFPFGDPAKGANLDPLVVDRQISEAPL